MGQAANKNLDDPQAVSAMDRADMLGKISRLAQQCREGWRLGLGWKVPDRFKNCQKLLVTGMGGSAIGGDLVAGLFGVALSRPMAVNRNDQLPSWVDRETLLLAVSYSGNTEETLSACDEAARRKIPTLAVSSGGKLETWARRKGVPHLQIPPGWPPRAALGYTTFVPAGLFAQWGWLRGGRPPLEGALDALELFIGEQLSRSVPESRNPAKKIAVELLHRLPVLYGACEGYEGIVYRWRTQLEENAKTLAFHHLFPEMTHNEISGWGRPSALMKRCTALFLEDPAISKRVRSRMEFVARLAAREGADVVRVSVPGQSIFERRMKLIALGDFASVYLGILYRVDPTPVERVEALKRWLR